MLLARTAVRSPAAVLVATRPAQSNGSSSLLKYPITLQEEIGSRPLRLLLIGACDGWSRGETNSRAKQLTQSPGRQTTWSSRSLAHSPQPLLNSVFPFARVAVRFCRCVHCPHRFLLDRRCCRQSPFYNTAKQTPSLRVSYHQDSGPSGLRRRTGTAEDSRLAYEDDIAGSSLVLAAADERTVKATPRLRPADARGQL